MRMLRARSVDPLEQLVVDGAVREHAAAGDAGLARRGEDPGHDAHGGVGDVGVLEDDVGRLAAELQRGADEPAGGGAAIRAPVAVLPVNEIFASAGVVDQRRAGLGAEPGDDVDGAGREAGLDRRARRAAGRWPRCTRTA